jgi:hypothetical protein
LADSLTNLTTGGIMKVRAIDAAGNADTTPASVRWRVLG